MNVTLWPADVEKLQRRALSLSAQYQTMTKNTKRDDSREEYLAEAEFWSVLAAQCLVSRGVASASRLAVPA